MHALQRKCFVLLVQATFKQSICTLQLSRVSQLSKNQHSDNFSFHVFLLLICFSFSLPLLLHHYLSIFPPYYPPQLIQEPFFIASPFWSILFQFLLMTLHLSKT